MPAAGTWESGVSVPVNGTCLSYYIEPPSAESDIGGAIVLGLLSEALDLVQGTPEEQRAHHWFATFCTALDKENTQGSDSTITMQETIDALKEGAVA